MKHVFLFCLSLVFFIPLKAQMVYGYDRAGNRISRSVVVLKSSLQYADSLSEQTEEEQMEKKGISEDLLTCKVTVYPNPTQGEVFVSISRGEEDAVSEISVFTDSGQFLVNLKTTGNTTLPVDLSSYPSGIYLIDFQQGKNKSFYKIIKQ